MQAETIPKIMSTIDMRTESHQILDRIDDRFLAAVHALLQTYDQQNDSDEVIGYSVGTNEPLLASEADDVFEAIVEDVKKGNYIEVDDLIAQKSARWQSSTKYLSLTPLKLV
ncbi:MAG: hypothetical protein DA408_19090 [Bacteroidetes bacterium]|nr:MAG: hypothetical protein DA408_19090 [Bacteroidota bacterium]